MPAATPSTPRSPPPWRWPPSSPGTPASAASASPSCTAPGSPAAETVDFGPARRPACTRDLFRLTGRIEAGPVRLAGGGGRRQRPRPAVLRHPLRRRRLCPHARPLGHVAAVRGDGPGHRAGQARPVAGLVHHAEDRQLRRHPAPAIPSSAAIYLPGGLPPVAPYQGRPGYFRLGRLPDTLERLAHAGLRDFYEGDVARSIAADFAAAGRRARRRRPAPLRGPHHAHRMEVAFAGRTLQLASGLTAGAHHGPRAGADPALARRAPDAAWFAALARAMRTAYAERLDRAGRRASRRPPKAAPPT